MKLLMKRYLSGSALTLLFLFIGIYWVITPHQKSFGEGTQIGNFWMPSPGADWHQNTFSNSVFEGVAYSKKINKSKVTISFLRWMPLDGIRFDMNYLKEVIKDRIGKKDIQLQFHETRFHRFRTLVSHKSYTTTTFQIKNVPDWNGVYGKNGIKVEQRTIQILCPPDQYVLTVTLSGQNPVDSQVFARSTWESLIQNMRFVSTTKK